jgi:hypothetical protein
MVFPILTGRCQLFFLVSVFPQALLALVSGHFVFLSFLSTWHNVFWFSLIGPPFGEHLRFGEKSNEMVKKIYLLQVF